ncbi:hypothetical protein HU200_014394 [Digitaria exilis]|uniref:F-box domain-containing protein n=1 Tax=Digitaria exilis TaxID=1010633 RepID=A0A835FCU0_9POAL|nr:hypothetical protein HU200_014394 [Digitaria exilis]
MGSHDVLLLLDLPDDILELILLSLQSPLWIVWAASTCKRWLRIISTTGFTRRFCTIHRRRPVVACTYYNRQGLLRPRFETSPSAATVAARHFSLDFVPAHRNECGWTIKDSRGSLLLLYSEEPKSWRRELIVCEPLTRRHVVIPPPKPHVFYRSAIAVLLAADDEQGGGIGMSSFRVLLCSEQDSHIRACMFTSGSFYWREKSIPTPPKILPIGFAEGRRYWHFGGKTTTVVALDQSTLKFSSFVLPGDNKDRRKVILTIGREGEVRIVVDGHGNMLKIFARQKGAGGEGAEEWALEKTIHVSAAMLGLPPQLKFFDLTWDQPEDAGMVQIRGYHGGASKIPMRFHLDMETMEVKCLPRRDVDYRISATAYPLEFPWPPRLRACTYNNA